MSGYVLFCHGIINSTETLDAKKRHNIRIVSIGTEGQLTSFCKSEVLLKFFLQFYGVNFLIELYNILVYLGDNYLLFNPTKSTAKYRFQIKCLFLLNEQDLRIVPQNRLRAYGLDETIVNLHLSNIPPETAVARFKISTKFLRPELLNSFQFPQKDGKSILITPGTDTKQLVYNDKVNFDLLAVYKTALHPELSQYYFDIRSSKVDHNYRNITFVQPMGIYKILEVTSQVSALKFLDSLSRFTEGFSSSFVLDTIKSLEPSDEPIYLFLNPCKRLSSTVAFSSEPMEKLVESLGQILVTEGRDVGSVEEQGKKAIARMNKQFTAKPSPPLGSKTLYQEQLAKAIQKQSKVQSQLAQIEQYLALKHQQFSTVPLVQRGPISAEISQMVHKKQMLQQELQNLKIFQKQYKKIIKQHGIQLTDLAKVVDQLQQQYSSESSRDFTASSKTRP